MMTLKERQDKYKELVKKIYLNWIGSEEEITELPSRWKGWQEDMSKMFMLGVDDGMIVAEQMRHGHFNEETV